MNLETVVAAMVSSLGISLPAAYFLAKLLIQHRLTEALEKRKIELSQQLETHKLGLTQQLEHAKGQIQLELARDKAVTEGAVKREVETQLGQLAAQRQYEYEARRRLYTAIGPLRFQLLLACRDLVGRVAAFHSKERYQLRLNGYYGRSTLYRLLRPVAIGDLIERQVGIADFAVDPAAVDCLRFRRTITRILSGDELVEGRRDLVWTKQVQHVYADSLSVCAQAVIKHDQNGIERILRFDEFTALLTQEGLGIVAPFDTLLEGFQPASKPVLWLRLVAYAAACSALVERLGKEAGFESRVFPLERLLSSSEDEFTQLNLTEVCQRVHEIELVPL